jgi:hypothetical protein
MKKSLLIVLCFFNVVLFSQVAPNFEVVDSDGNIHRLYEDYLDKGKVVVLKIFFVDCPPCNAIASATQEKYVKWGSGKEKVQFIEMSTKLTDRNSHVREYKLKHGITFPSISADGGGFDAVKPYVEGKLGAWSGTPFFAVISPNRKMQYEVIFNQLDNFIDQGLKSEALPTKINIKINGLQTNLPPNVDLILKNDTIGGAQFNITKLTDGTNNFEYPSQKFPRLQKPVIVLESSAPIQNGSINVSDLVTVSNHILKRTLMTSPSQLLAADLNESGSINVSDIVLMRKIILQLIDALPNGVPSYKILPAKIPIDLSAEVLKTLNLEFELIKMGNVK